MDPIRELVELARERSPFYKDHFQSMGKIESLEDIPIVDPATYWEMARRDGRSVMTETQVDGIITSTGGTTGLPKFTSYSQIELQRMSHLLSLGLLSAGLRAGDRVGNLFKAGELYPAFLLHAWSMLTLPLPAVQVPIGADVSEEMICETLDRCGVNVLVSTVTILAKLAQYCQLRHRRTFPGVRCIMYAGEILVANCMNVLQQTFPKATVRPCMYGSTDCGVVACASSLGSVSLGALNVQPLQVFASAVHLEIVTEDNVRQVIRKNNIPGMIVVTNLIRRLSPILRVPVGDRAEWIDYDAGIFRLLGRESTEVRLSPTLTIDVQGLRQSIQDAVSSVDVVAVQVVIRRGSAKNELECLIAARPPEVEKTHQDIMARFDSMFPQLRQHIDRGDVAIPKFHFVTMADMHVSRSGKLLDVIDLAKEAEMRSV